MGEPVPSLTDLERVTIRTTLPMIPFPAHSDRQVFTSSRLRLRSLEHTDLDMYGALRHQPEVMQWTGQGRPDVDIVASREHLATMLPPHDVSKYNFAICLKESDELIGVGGCHQVDGELGWPVMGYMLRSEFWGKGFATEFVSCFLKAWWSLPRNDVELQVDRATVDDVAGQQSECLIAVTVDTNTASQRVLRKCGLQLVKAWTEPDLRDSIKTVVLLGFGATA